jgi:hypothetical protein
MPLSPDDQEKIAREFPDFDITTLPEIPAGFIAEPWHHEACPRFINEAARLALWIDYADPAMRDMGPDFDRFLALKVDEEGNAIEGAAADHCASEDWPTVLAWIVGRDPGGVAA